MADRRKRRQPLGSMPTAQQQRRKRPCISQEILTIVKAAVAIAILLSVVATTAAVIKALPPRLDSVFMSRGAWYGRSTGWTWLGAVCFGGCIT